MADWFALPEEPLRVLAGGAWMHGDEPLVGKVAALFARHVAYEPPLGYVVRIGRNIAPLQVDDTPFVVRSAQPRLVAGELVGVKLILNDGAHEELAPNTLAQGDGHVLYCTIVRSGYRLPCRFAPAHYHALALFMEPLDGSYALRVGTYLHRVAEGLPVPRLVTGN